MELLEFEEEVENNAAIDNEDDDKYDKTDLFSEEDDEENNDLCSNKDEYRCPPCLTMRTYDLYQLSQEKYLSIEWRSNNQ